MAHTILSSQLNAFETSDNCFHQVTARTAPLTEALETLKTGEERGRFPSEQNMIFYPTFDPDLFFSF